MKAHRSRGAGWVVAQLALFAVQFASVLAGRAQWPAPVSRVMGASLLAVSAVCGLPGIRSLGRNLTPLPEPKTDGQLVTTGIYAHIRHPLYASVIATGFGWAFLWRSWPALILAAVQALFLREKAKQEEKRLRDRFPDYAAYARQVPRFLPHLSLPSRKAVSIL
ncbi:methyltransferase family protein [Verrucomicrobiota bacterium sgz303538]